MKVTPKKCPKCHNKITKKNLFVEEEGQCLICVANDVELRVIKLLQVVC